MSTDDGFAEAVQRVTEALHAANEWQYDECDHGTYSGGTSHGQPYAMCQIMAERVTRAAREDVAERVKQARMGERGRIAQQLIDRAEVTGSIRQRSTLIAISRHIDAETLDMLWYGKVVPDDTTSI